MMKWLLYLLERRLYKKKQEVIKPGVCQVKCVSF